MTETRIAIVTGASRGIGAATCLELARHGHDIVLVARDRTSLEQVAAQVQRIGRDSLVLAGDLSDLTFAESVVITTAARFGQIDVLVNNAIWREQKTMLDISLESWERTLRIGLTTPAFMARWSAEFMKPLRRGVIVNVSSIMSRQNAGTSPAYVACKGGLESLTYELAALYGRAGIRVVSVCPGAIDTDRSRDFVDQEGNDLTDKIKDFSEEMISLGRWGTPEEVAALIGFAASDKASYLTATSIDLDGGWLRQHLPWRLRRQLAGEHEP